VSLDRFKFAHARYSTQLAKYSMTVPCHWDAQWRQIFDDTHNAVWLANYEIDLCCVWFVVESNCYDYDIVKLFRFDW